MEKIADQQAQTESKAQLVGQINTSLRAGDYSRSLQLLRASHAEFPGDADLLELEKLAQDGVKRNADAQRLITESQEMFAQQKPAEAIQLLRQAYELDKNYSLARTILANALVEHAQSIVETDWLQAETLTNQAVALNPAHPTAKTVLSLIVYQKKTSSVEEWVSQASKLQSSGDLFAALAWVAEGLAVHPHDSKLLLIQDAIQRDQEARRRQTRRDDLDDLRRMQREIDAATDVAAKQALAGRIQGVAAKHWTDGEILSIANALLLRLGLVSQDSSSARGKGAPLILHVPRPATPTPPPPQTRPRPTGNVAASPASSSPVSSSAVPSSPAPSSTASSRPASTSAVASAPAVSESLPAPAVPPKVVSASDVSAGNVASTVAASTVAVNNAPTSSPTPGKVSPGKVYAAAQPKIDPPKEATVPAADDFVTAAKFTRPFPEEEPRRPNVTMLIAISAAATIIVIAAIVFFGRKTNPPQSATNSAAAPAVSAPTASSPAGSPPAASAPTPSIPAAPAQAIPEPPMAPSSPSSDSAAGKVTMPETQSTNDQARTDSGPYSAPSSSTESGHNVGSLLVIAGQDDARVFLNGSLQPQLTQAGQLRIPNLELKDYVVQVSKSGFQDPPQQKIRIRKGESARLVFSLQPQPAAQPAPRLASLNIHGGTPGTAVLVDQALVGTVQADGTLSVSTVNPGDHLVELRKEKFTSRQLKEHFAAGGAISLAAADAALAGALGELKITFAPADAKVGIVKGDSLTMVSSGVPLNLAAGTYMLTARTADRFTRSSTLEVIGGQSKNLDLSLAPDGMSKWESPTAWKQEKDSFIRKGGDFVLYSVVPASGTFVFSAMPARNHRLQWVLNYVDARNYVLFQLDDNTFSRTVIRNGEKTDEVKVPDRSDKKALRMFHIRVSSTELVHEMKNGESWTVVDRWTQPGVNLGAGKFGFYIPGNDEIAISGFVHYADLNVH